jgi:hypothetical protein
MVERVGGRAAKLCAGFAQGFREVRLKGQVMHPTLEDRRGSTSGRLVRPGSAFHFRGGDAG